MQAKGAVDMLGRFRKLAITPLFFTYLAVILQHGIAKAYQIAWIFFEYFQKYSSGIQRDGPVKEDVSPLG